MKEERQIAGQKKLHNGQMMRKEIRMGNYHTE
jgi:hypothetical protein